MTTKSNTVGDGNNAKTYAELYKEYLVRKHGPVTTTETQTYNLVGKVYFSKNGRAYDTCAQATAADNRYKESRKENKNQRHQNAVESITRNANALKNRGFRITKQRK